MKNIIVRTLCYFCDNPTTEITNKVDAIAETLVKHEYTIQTKRICSPSVEPLIQLNRSLLGNSYLFGVGTLSRDDSLKYMPDIFNEKNISFNLDLSDDVRLSDIDLLLKIIRIRPELSFNFSYVFNNLGSSPYFPSANYEKSGFAIGLQPTDLSADCKSVDQWLQNLKSVWTEINSLFQVNDLFLGIDSSIAPLYTGGSSVINFIKRLGMSFSHSVTTDIYTKITTFIKSENPRPIGLCGLMLPCLEDFELAEEYERGNFSIERNLFLSLHSGLGIDTYPVGINENPERIMEILTLVKALSNKYTKPLSVRFVSDGKAKIGEKTNFNNPYLKDVVIKNL